MKRFDYFIVLPLVAVLMLTSCTGKKSSEDKEVKKSEAVGVPVNVDVDLSKVYWKGEMLGVYTHEGEIKLKSAMLEMKGDQVTGGSFVVDMATIVPMDNNYMPAEGRTPEKLVAHLSSPDFFDVASYPEASFKISSVDGANATGMLTVRGVSNEETVTGITVVPGESGKLVNGDLTFDRQKYGVAYETKMKDMVLSNEIVLKVTLFVSE